MSRIVLCLLLVLTAAPALAEIDAATAFEKIKSLDGTWQGTIDAAAGAEGAEEVTGQAVTHIFRVSANSSVVMETMNPGTPHEMINMYHIDGEELVITHYCAGGNQPTMRLDRQAASADDFPFVFSGGTNLNPAVDSHIHESRIRFTDANTLVSAWVGYDKGEAMGEMRFLLHRQAE